LPSATLSERIKQGIRRARREGKPIGIHGRRLAALHRGEAVARALTLHGVIDEFRRDRVSYRDMVRRLNARGEPTPTGMGRWHVKTLQRLVERTRDADPLLKRSAVAIEQMRDLRTIATGTRTRTDGLVSRTRALVEELRSKRDGLVAALGGVAPRD
jgi:hypothetical protein